MLRIANPAGAVSENRRTVVGGVEGGRAPHDAADDVGGRAGAVGLAAAVDRVDRRAGACGVCREHLEDATATLRRRTPPDRNTIVLRPGMRLRLLMTSARFCIAVLREHPRLPDVVARLLLNQVLDLVQAVAVRAEERLLRQASMPS